MVVTIAAVVASIAFVSVSAAAERQRSQLSLNTLLADVEQVRNAHVATGRKELLIICADCVDTSGAAQAPQRTNVLRFYVAEDRDDVTSGRVLHTGTYEGLALRMTTPMIAIDGLGRSVGLNGVSVPAEPVPAQETIRIDDGRAKHELVFSRDGRLQPTFASEILPPPAHAQNLSERVSRDVTPRGRFSGDPGRSRQLLLH